MVRTTLIWACMALAYGLFVYWYTGNGKPLSAAEVDMYMERMEARDRDPARMAATRRFLESDTGGEFFMVNLMNLRDQPLPVGDVQPGESSGETLQRYTTDHMAQALRRRAGYFVVVGGAASSNIEQWGLDYDPEWRRAGVVRYRSRRDLMEITTDPRFIDRVQYKFAAMDQTFAFPIDPAITQVNPKHVVFMLLVAAGAVLQLILVPRRVRD